MQRDEILEYWSIYCWEKSQCWRGKDVQLKCRVVVYSQCMFHACCYYWGVFHGGGVVVLLNV